jgi:putative ABC transport system permease protein
MKKSNTPLHKRLPRLLREELGKYLVIFIFLVGTIGFVSGFLVADNSMISAYREGFEKYHVENGKFLVKEEMTDTECEKAEQNGISLYENFYVEESAPNDSTLRIFKWREEVNLVCLMKGEKPVAKDEIAIDRMYAENNNISVGDSVDIGGRTCRISGFVALPDYSCLFSDNSDSMFDASMFGVAVMSEAGWSSWPESHIQYGYSWIYDTQPENDSEENEISEKLMEKLNRISTLEDFVPRYLNQAIQFTGEDMGGDKAMIITLLYVLIVILAFVFGVTTANTIDREACVIGTLRATGYTKRELISHYMTLPILVTVVAAIVGNILGYTVLKQVCVEMYYGSYSLPSYVTVWNAEAFLLTTVIPLILMVVINLLILIRKFSLSPIRFLRKDLRRGKRKGGVCLPERLAFMTRFRMRVIIQNFSNYVILFVGVIFANLLLMFGLLMPVILKDYQKDILSNMLSKYQYVLQVPEYELGDGILNDFVQESLRISLSTDNPDAEACGIYTLSTYDGKYQSEKITIYGISPDSKYVQIEEDDTFTDADIPSVYVSDGYAEKFGVRIGDTIALKESYEDKEYTFLVAGTYNYPGALSVFMSLADFRTVFDKNETYFNGYFSDSEIVDVNEDYIASVITQDDLTKLSRQLDLSMGGMMKMVDVFAVLMFVILIYLLSKIIIEKNAQSISMIKILGYQTGEISLLYIVSTSIVVIFFMVISLPMEAVIMKWLFLTMMMTSISGWMNFSINSVIYVQMLIIGIGSYAVVAALEYRKIRRVPLDEALKHVE